MKILSPPNRLIKVVLCAMVASTAPVSAVIINFQSEFPVNVIDSQGATITDSMGYMFQLGAFDNGFTPTYANMSQWADNWVIFTELSYSQPALGDDPPVPGYFIAGQATLEKDGLAGDPSDVGGYSSYYDGSQDPLVHNAANHDEMLVAGSTFDFSGQQGYLWIYDSNDPANARIEQFLGTSTSWIFPDKFVETAEVCCDGRGDILWSVSDINEPPTIGKTPPGPPETLQTIPEPGVSAFALVGSLGLLAWRRRRA